MGTPPWRRGRAPRSGVSEALAREELAGLALATWVRCAIMAVMAVLLVLEAPTEANLYYLAIMALFAVLGLAHLGLARLGLARPGFGVAALKYAFTLLDVALVAAALILPNPLGQPDLPLPTTLRFAIFPYFYLMLAFTAFGFTPLVVLWQGLAITAAWGAAVYLVMILPETVTEQDFLVLDVQDWMAMYFDPQFLSLRDAIEQGFVFILVAATLATVVWRSRRLAERESRAARERANLSRYFSPNVVEELANLDQPLSTIRSQDVGVVFVDIVGFTKICETLEPSHVMRLLRAYHGRVERVVFEHGGTLNKFIGDGAMAHLRHAPHRPRRRRQHRGLRVLAGRGIPGLERRARGAGPGAGCGRYRRPLRAGDPGRHRHRAAPRIRGHRRYRERGQPA